SLFMAVNMATYLGTPHLIQIIIDRGVVAGNHRLLLRLVGLLIAIMIANNITWGLFLYVSGKMGQNVLLDLRVRLFDKFQVLSLAFHERYTSGRVVARLTNDIDALSELLQTGLHEALTSILAVVGIAIILLIKEPRLAAATLVSFPLVIGLTWWFRKHSEKAYRAVRDAVALVIVFYNESLGGIRAVHAFRREPRNKAIFGGLNGRYRDANYDSNILAAKYGPGVRFLGRLSNAIVLLYGGHLVLTHQMSIGVMVGFTMYLGRFFGPLQDLSQFYNVFQAASSALEKLSGVLEEPPSVPEPGNPVVPDRVDGRVTFEHVTFAYRDKSVLHDVTLDVPAGQTVALVGKTGAGKSTMAKMIARFYDPTEGTISIDGIDARQFPEWRLRQAVAVVTQESFLFGGTVADNIIFGRPTATRDEVEDAARAIGAYDFIASLPDGFDTDVKRRGGRLSAGQRQLIAFARAFLADPSILILDEATSSLDIPTERLVQHALRTLLSDRTAFIIAHRLTTVEIADRVLVVDDGRVVEDGSPAELIAGAGRYAALHEQWLQSLAS
ncbi:MAG: ABC transporter ATP-binding protein/permease, partial [Actinobacteria bacterium]|nr:ABC transporter ATP-binding protein/permease [Actinomycetota bacterium]